MMAAGGRLGTGRGLRTDSCWSCRKAGAGRVALVERVDGGLD
jgi:hypothetical protein